MGAKCVLCERPSGAHAEAAAFDKWGPNRLYTYIDASKVRSVNPGYCFKMAGWKYQRLSAGGKHLLSKFDELAAREKASKDKQETR